MKIAVLGTGAMGSALAEAFLKAGHQVVVYNRTAAKMAPLVALGATAAATPVDAIKASDVALTVLIDAAAVRETLLGDAARASLAGRKLLNVTTTTPTEIVELARDVAACGGALSETTVAVYPHHIRNGEGQFIIAGPEADDALWRTLLLGIGQCVHRAGVVGDATKAEMPLVPAFMFNVIATAYAVVIGKKLNVPPAILEHYLTANPTLSITGAKSFLPQMLARQYSESMASIDNMGIAANITLDQAKSLDIPTKIIVDMIDLFKIASERGLGAKDVSGVFEILMDPGKQA